MEKSTLWPRILYIVLAVVYIIAGIYAFMYPIATDAAIGLFIGAFILVSGIVLAISYFLNKRENKSVWSLILAIALIILGLVMLGNDLLHIFAITYFAAYVTAIALIVIGVIKSVDSFTYKKEGLKSWWSVLLLGILDVIVGVLLFMNPLTIAWYLGAGLIANGISDLVIAFTVL